MSKKRKEIKKKIFFFLNLCNDHIKWLRPVAFQSRPALFQHFSCCCSKWRLTWEKRDQKKKGCTYVRIRAQGVYMAWRNLLPLLKRNTVRTLFIPIRIRRCGSAKWIEIYDFALGFYPNHRWFFLYVHINCQVKREKNQKTQMCRMKRWSEWRRGGKLYNNPKEEEKKKKRFFSGSAFRKSNRTQSHPLSHSHDKKKKK